MDIRVGDILTMKKATPVGRSAGRFCAQGRIFA